MRSKSEDYRHKNLTHPGGRLLFDCSRVSRNGPSGSTRTTLRGGLYLALLYAFLFARLEAAGLRLAGTLLRLALVRLPTAFFRARRARGFAAATFLVNAFWTAPALAAIVPNVDPIDSATFVRIASSFDGLWLSTSTLLYSPLNTTPLPLPAYLHRP